MNIAFLGAGLMGQPIATNLLRAGYPLTVWNRTQAKLGPLVEAGARPAATPREAVRDANIVILMLYNADIVSELLYDGGVADEIPRGAIVVDMVTSPPARSREHAERLKARGIRYLDAPVSGGTQGAADASLAIMVGAEPQDFEQVRAVLAQMGNPTRVGPVGTGQLAKCVNQVIVGITIGAVAEGLVIAEAGGADPAAVREALMGGFADSRILREHGKRMVERDFTPGGRARSQLTDLNIILEVAQSLSLNLPITQLVRDLYETLVGYGSELDHSALFLEIERRNADAWQLADPDPLGPAESTESAASGLP